MIESQSCDFIGGIKTFAKKKKCISMLSIYYLMLDSYVSAVHILCVCVCQ